MRDEYVVDVCVGVAGSVVLEFVSDCFFEVAGLVCSCDLRDDGVFCGWVCVGGECCGSVGWDVLFEFVVVVGGGVVFECGVDVL